MTTSIETRDQAERLEFLSRWSAYVDAFLARRSILGSSLFPEKSRQMWFGYEYTQRVLEDVVAWLEARMAPAELGGMLRRPLSDATGLHLMGSTWIYTLGLLGRLLEERSCDPGRAIPVLDYLRAGYEAYTERIGWRTILAAPGGSENLVLRKSDADELAAALRPPAGLATQRVIASLTNYSWLLECESRQGVFNHGPYRRANGSSIVVREFGDLSGSWYPWVDAGAAPIEPGPTAVLIELDPSVDASFDAFGVVRMEPEAYDAAVVGVGVITRSGPVANPVEWLSEVDPALKDVHRALFRTVAAWSPRERFLAGASSYARMWANLVDAAGGTSADRERMVIRPLSEMGGDALDRHLDDLDTPALWQWAAAPERPTILDPLIRALNAAGRQS